MAERRRGKERKMRREERRGGKEKMDAPSSKVEIKDGVCKVRVRVIGRPYIQCIQC